MATTHTVSITLNIPTGVSKEDALSWFCLHHNYEENVPNPDFDPDVEGSQPTISNPESKPDFLKRTIGRQLVEQIKAGRLQAQQQVTKEAVETELKDVSVS